MQGAQILRNEAYIEVRCNDEGCSATQPFGLAQGREHVERQMDFLGSRQYSSVPMERKRLKSIIESLIFVSGNPLRIDSIQEVLENVDKRMIQSCLDELVEEYRQLDRSFHLVKVAEGFQFRTKPQYAQWIQQSKKMKPTRLTKAALETLAIVAYKQPIIKAEIEAIRGVDSGWVLRALLEKQLIRIMGRKAIPGRPLVYGTSKYFLEFFGLESISSLPTLREIQELGKGMEEINSQEPV